MDKRAKKDTASEFWTLLGSRTVYVYPQQTNHCK